MDNKMATHLLARIRNFYRNITINLQFEIIAGFGKIILKAFKSSGV
jgi:hypothetical protein